MSIQESHDQQDPLPFLGQKGATYDYKYPEVECLLQGDYIFKGTTSSGDTTYKLHQVEKSPFSFLTALVDRLFKKIIPQNNDTKLLKLEITLFTISYLCSNKKKLKETEKLLANLVRMEQSLFPKDPDIHTLKELLKNNIVTDKEKLKNLLKECICNTLINEESRIDILKFIYNQDGLENILNLFPDSNNDLVVTLIEQLNPEEQQNSLNIIKNKEKHFSLYRAAVLRINDPSQVDTELINSLPQFIKKGDTQNEMLFCSLIAKCIKEKKTISYNQITDDQIETIAAVLVKIYPNCPPDNITNPHLKESFFQYLPNAFFSAERQLEGQPKIEPKIQQEVIKNLTNNLPEEKFSSLDQQAIEAYITMKDLIQLAPTKEQVTFFLRGLKTPNDEKEKLIDHLKNTNTPKHHFLLTLLDPNGLKYTQQDKKNDINKFLKCENECDNYAEYLLSLDDTLLASNEPDQDLDLILRKAYLLKQKPENLCLDNLFAVDEKNIETRLTSIQYATRTFPNKELSEARTLFEGFLQQKKIWHTYVNCTNNNWIQNLDKDLATLPIKDKVLFLSFLAKKHPEQKETLAKKFPYLPLDDRDKPGTDSNQLLRKFIREYIKEPGNCLKIDEAEQAYFSLPEDLRKNNALLFFLLVQKAKAIPLDTETNINTFYDYLTEAIQLLQKKETTSLQFAPLLTELLSLKTLQAISTTIGLEKVHAKNLALIPIYTKLCLPKEITQRLDLFIYLENNLKYLQTQKQFPELIFSKNLDEELQQLYKEYYQYLATLSDNKTITSMLETLEKIELVKEKDDP